MRKSTRLAQGNHTQSHQSPDLTGSVAPAPRTPHHQKPNGAALKQLIQSLDAKWQLGLRVDEHRSPAQDRTAADIIKARIQHLFFVSKPTLDEVLATFESIAAGFAHSQHLDLLDGLLKSKRAVNSSQSRTDTFIGTANHPPKSLSSTEQIPHSGGRFQERESRYNEVKLCATPVDSGSSTDVDTDDEFVTPRSQSPSPSCRSANRRQKSAGSSVAPIATPPLFKKPALHMARSFQAGTTSFSSVNTSFNNTAVSSQETNATSINTSFTSHDGDVDPDRARFCEAETAAFVVEKQREVDRILSQNQSRESNSSYDSIDENELLKIEIAHQKEQKLEPAVPNGKSATCTSVHAGTTQITSRSSNGSATEYLEHLSTIEPLHPVDPSVHYPTLELADIRQRNASEEPVHDPPLQAITPAKSPEKLSWYIKNLPYQNIFMDTDNLPRGFLEIPYFVLIICYRLAALNSVTPGTLLQLVKDDSINKDAKSFWKAIDDKIQIGPRESAAVWTASRSSFEGFTFKAKVSFNTRFTQPVFKLELSQIEAERSCQFQRMFGSDRFLYLTFPSFSENIPKRFTRSQMRQIENKWQSWLMQEHSFLRRKWRAFYVEPIQKRNTGRKADDADKRVVLFATEGLDITKPMSVNEMLNEFLDFDINQWQNLYKAYSRIALGLSRTIPTLVFKPSQIRLVKDIRSDGTPEANEFNDEGLDWDEKCSQPQVMNDGCARISVGAARIIWEMYCRATGSDEPLPSAFQGRIRGAKGMWMVSAEAHTRDEEHNDIWIEISDSQSKYEPHEADKNDATFNSHRLTFNYVKHSHVNGSTDLHISFIPILVDRGVKRDVIADFIIKHLNVERAQLLDMLSEPVKLHNWVTKQSSATSGVIPWEAALPVSQSEKVKLLLRAGFTPQDSPFLAKVLINLIRQRQSVMEQKLRAPLGSATFLLGLADPEGVLEPGQVHISFSLPFVDEFSRQTYRHLDGLEVLIARQPACRRSDIQKVRVVTYSKLAHLRDVIVFPTRGQYPLAGKLQGGDYDGDIFWTCWENDLVESFKNAPAPLAPPGPEEYGIKKDPEKINEVMNPRDPSNGSFDLFLKKAFEFRIAPSLLGKVTNFLEKQAYKENKIFSIKIKALCDVHDLLVDAPKQAFKFTDDDFKDLILKKLKCGNPKIPAYKQAMDDNAKSREIGEGKKGMKEYNGNPKNILDHLYFNIILKHNTETRDQLSAKLPKDQEDDKMLQLPFTQLRDEGVLKAEFEHLRENFERIRQEWNRSLGDKKEISRERYSKLLQSCYAAFRALMPSPSSSSDREVAPLVKSYFGPGHPVLWETIRASAIYTWYPKKTTLVWHMAGKELARLKAAGNPDTYHIVPAIFADMKPKPHKAPKLAEDDGDDEDESNEDLESALEKAMA